MHTAAGEAGALKVLIEADSPFARSMDPGRRGEDRARLRREAEALAALEHRHVVRLIDVVDDPVLAVVTELVQGPNLAEWMARGPWPQSSLNAIFDGILAGVQCAHDAGWVHRDLKPANILVVPGDLPIAKVADFGLAHLSTATRLTRSGTVMGTPSYMAPEQVRDPSRVEPTADVFALGAILYELWCDRPPFQSTDVTATLQQASAGLYADPTALRPDLPETVAAAIAGALHPDPASRIPDCQTFRQVLEGKREWSRSKAPFVAPTVAIPTTRSRSWRAWTVTSAGAIAVVGLAGAWWVSQPAPDVERPHISDDPVVQGQFDASWAQWRGAELESAATTLEPVVRAEPDDGWVALLDAMIEASRRHEDAAMGALARATPPADPEGIDLLKAFKQDYRGGDPAVWTALADAHPASEAIQAVACVQLGNAAGATRACRRATAVDGFALVHYLRARNSLIDGDLATSKDDLDALLAAAPNHVPGRILHTGWLEATGRWDAAVTEAEAVVQLAPDRSDARLSRASARANAGDLEGARDDYEHARASLRGPALVLAASDEAQVRLGLGEVALPYQLLQDVSDVAEAEERWGDVIFAQTRLGWFGWYLRDAARLTLTRQVLARAAVGVGSDSAHALEIEAHQTYLAGLEAIIRQDALAVNAARQHIQRLDVAVVATIDRETAVAVLLAYELALGGDTDRLLHIANTWPACEAHADGGLLLESYGQHEPARQRLRSALDRCSHAGMDRFFRFVAAQALADDAARRGDAEDESTFRAEMRRIWPNPEPQHPRITTPSPGRPL